MTSFRVCAACKEPLRPNATVCPRCRTSQSAGRMNRLGRALKWIGGGTTVISLVIGVATLNGLFRGWSERRDAVAEMVSAARELDESGDYRAAWTLFGDALMLDPGSPDARHGQRDLAMNWLRNVRTGGNETFTEIADLTIPVLCRGLPSADGERAADLLAHVAWAYFLKGREGWIPADPDSLYARAIEADPDNPYANAMWGHWLLSHHEDAAAAKPRFETAFASGREREWVRGLQLSALKWPLEGRRIFTSDTFQQQKLVAVARELLRVANEMRLGGEPRPSADARRLILRCYGQGYKAETLELMLPALPPADQLATVHWLTQDDTHDERSTGKAQERFVIARLTEAKGDSAEALALYAELGEQDLFYEGLDVRVDEALERLTGEPTARTLDRHARRYSNDERPSDEDPWTFHAATLRHFEPRYTSPNFVDATEFLFTEVADEGPQRHRVDDALALLEESREHVSHVDRGEGRGAKLDRRLVLGNVHGGNGAQRSVHPPSPVGLHRSVRSGGGRR